MSSQDSEKRERNFKPAYFLSYSWEGSCTSLSSGHKPWSIYLGICLAYCMNKIYKGPCPKHQLWLKPPSATCVKPTAWSHELPFPDQLWQTHSQTPNHEQGVSRGLQIWSQPRAEAQNHSASKWESKQDISKGTREFFSRCCYYEDVVYKSDFYFYVRKEVLPNHHFECPHSAQLPMNKR